MRYALLLVLGLAVPAAAQVPPNVEAELQKIGQIVDPACTAKLYRPLMPKNDFNTYWPPDAAQPASKEIQRARGTTSDRAGPLPADAAGWAP